MKISFLSSKKCSTCNCRLLVIFIIGSLLSVSHAITTPKAEDLRKELEKQSGAGFHEILKIWESKYGSQAVPALLKIAENKKSKDTDRYIALMGMGRLGGPATSSLAIPFLKDKSWMIRNGALELLQILNAQEEARAALPLLKDRALVVRMKAIETIHRLRPPGSLDAILETLFEENNYHRGKAQWVPQKALNALRDFPLQRTHLQKVSKLLQPSKDPELTLHAIALIESVTNEKSPSSHSLKERSEHWKNTLGQN